MPNTPPTGVTPSIPTSSRPERRAHRRALLGLPVMIETESESRPGKALNVSGGGMALESEVELSLGEAVEVYFELPIGYAIEARAQVVRKDGSLAAVRFMNLPRESELALRSFCRISGLHRVPKL